MTEQSPAELRRRRRQLLRKLPPLDAVLRGSLIERYKRCGNPRCRCADGPGHGPKYYLSVSHAGESPLNRTPFGGRHEATMSVIHGRPVRSLATNREPAVGG